jgi:uncharacterized protein (TIGR01777 family)
VTQKAANLENNLRLVYQTELPVSIEEAFVWHLRKGAFERLLPPWVSADLLFSPGSPDEEKSKVGLKLKWGPFRCKWILEYRDYTFPREFSDVQVRGPFRHYLHRRRFLTIDPISSQLTDEITYRAPLLNKKIQKEFSRLFAWQHAILREDMKVISHYHRTPLRILLSGASGFIGSNLKIFLQLAGHEVIRLVRGREKMGEDAIYWDPIHGSVHKEDFEGFDVVVHLAGAGIAQGRWTKNKKERLFLSRCRDTWLLSHVLCHLYRPPKVLFCASAIGFYGDRSDEELMEDSPQGSGFLADLCGKWEKATEVIENRGTRVIHARFGAVLGAKGGMLKKLLGPMHWGLGGRMGSGTQWISWIGLDDLLGACYHCLMKEEISGPVNFAAPSPLIQSEFIRILAKKLGRPAFCHLPGWLLKAALGEMAREMILSSQNAKPVKLLKTGYTFRYPDLKTALDFVM